MTFILLETVFFNGKRSTSRFEFVLFKSENIGTQFLDNPSISTTISVKLKCSSTYKQDFF